MEDSREKSAYYYDLNPDVPDDIPFYLEQIPSPDAQILELGCGTGRVTMALAPYCGYIFGVDNSQAMLMRCREKLIRQNIPTSRADIELFDITRFDLSRRFDLIIAPFRVIQNLETDAQLQDLFRVIHAHLAPNGRCILNVFHPNIDKNELLDWASPGETLNWTIETPNGTITCHDRRPRIDPEKMIIYPDLVYRHYKGNNLVDESILHIAMRCFYPHEFCELITSHGFYIIEKWGGYHGEKYGEGPELVIAFTHNQGSKG